MLAVAGATAALATNTDFAFKADGQTVARWGRGPALIERVTGRVAIGGLGVDAHAVRAVPLSPTGKALARRIAARREQGAWSIPLGTPPTTWMLIEVTR